MLRPYKLSQIRSCCAVAAERSALATRPCWVPRHYPGIPAAALVMAVALTITTRDVRVYTRTRKLLRKRFKKINHSVHEWRQ